MQRWVWAVCLLAMTIGAPTWGDQVTLLSGHGGPVKDIAVDPNSDTVLTASFDYAMGQWSLVAPDTPIWFDGHRAAVNAVAFLPAGRAASAGDDFAIRIWDLDTGVPIKELTGHQGKILGLAVSADGRWLASASWDGSIGLWALDDLRLIRRIKTGTNVNDVAFGPDNALYSAGFDGTIRRWSIPDGAEQQVLVRHGFGINRLALNASAGWLAYGALDGGTRALRLSDGTALADLTLDRRPILALALSHDGTRLAVGDGEGYIMVVDTETWTIINDFKAALQGPIWALAFSADGTRILAGGIDDAVFVWPADQDSDAQMATDTRSFLTDPAEMDNGARQFYRKCSICHTLTPDTARRAGPSLYGIFGRKAGSLPGYPYSQAMQDIDLVWSEDTIGKLFELGPDVYTPGSKMPMQRITAASDRADLLNFLKAHTTAKTAKGD